jgi:osmoprotectant transport system permease protein
MILGVEEPLVDWDWVGRHLDDIRAAVIEHIQLTAVAVGIGFAISMAMALVSIRFRWSYGILASFGAVVYAVPAVALFAFLIPLMGVGFWTAEVALISYTILILLRNIVAGFDGVPDHVKEAADGMGYEPWRRLTRIELPLALPAIVAGLRIATVTTIGLVTLAFMVGVGGLGDFINDGLDRDFSTPVIIGTVLSIALAVTFDLMFVILEWLMTPWTRKQRPDTRIDPGMAVGAAEVALDG